jgi:hypothetical protein
MISCVFLHQNSISESADHGDEDSRAAPGEDKHSCDEYKQEGDENGQFGRFKLGWHKDFSWNLLVLVNESILFVGFIWSLNH